MGKAGAIIKTTGAVIATTMTILTALRENPQLSDGVNTALDKLKAVTRTDNPKLRFDGKLAAIDACADAVEENFPEAPEPPVWRVRTKTLRMRGELAWNANEGKRRRQALKGLVSEATELLELVNARLTELATPADSLESGTGSPDGES